MSCILYPNEVGTTKESQLYKDLYKMTKDRELTNSLWALASSSAYREAVGLPKSEPTLTQFINSFDRPQEILGEEVYLNYVNNKIDSESKTYNSVGSALQASNLYQTEFNGVIPVLTNSAMETLAEVTFETEMASARKTSKKGFDNQVNPYKPNISITLDIDRESADADGFGAMAVLKSGDEIIGTIPMQQQIKSTKDFKFTKYVDINSVAGAAEIFDEYRNQGFGKAGYWELGMWLAKNGSILRSAKDGSRTEDATRVWKSLERDGYAKKVNDRYEFINNVSKAVNENERNTEVFPTNDNNINDSIKLKFVTDSYENQKTAYKQSLLKSLNDRLINLINRLGFDVKETESLEQDGVFSPMNAETNASGLKTVIQIAKGLVGKQALPEEISHLLIEGMQKHPLITRLLTALQTNQALTKEILGDEYDAYAEKYNSNLKLAKEAAARLLAQHMIDREGINGSIKLLSERAFNIIQNRLAKGDETEVDALLKEFYNELDSFTDSLSDIDSVLRYFSAEDVMKGGDLYHLNNSIKSAKDLAIESLNTLQKRIKIEQLSKTSRQLNDKDQADLKVLHSINDSIEKHKNGEACIQFLQAAITDCDDLKEKLYGLADPAIKGQAYQKMAISTLNRIARIKESYSELVSTMAGIRSDEELIKDLSNEDISEIITSANQVQQILSELDTAYKKVRLKALASFFSKYWKKDFTLKNAEGQDVKITLEDILQSGYGEISWYDHYLTSMEEASDQLLQLVHMAYKDAARERDEKLSILRQKIGAITDKYIQKTGSRDTSFCYEKDENGIPTGMLISDIDYTKYYRDRHIELERLKALYPNEKDIVNIEINKWDRLHQEVSLITKERVPKGYPSNALSKLNEAQREYYDSMLELKKELDNLLPSNKQHTFRAPQKRRDNRDNLLHGDIKGIWKTTLDNFRASTNDTEYGEYAILDETGNKVSKVPTFYTTFLPKEERHMLETNLSDALMAYGAMAHNYNSMMKMVGVMELTKSAMADRDIHIKNGNKTLYERFKLVTTVQREVTKKVLILLTMIDQISLSR